MFLYFMFEKEHLTFGGHQNFLKTNKNLNIMKKVMVLLAAFMLLGSFGAFASKKSFDLKDIDNTELNSDSGKFEKKTLIAGYKCFSLSCTAICVYFTYEPTWYEQLQVQITLQGLLCGGSNEEPTP